MVELEKNWTLESEKKIMEKWKEAELFKFDKKAKKIYSIDTPPPYVNAPIHIGHATTYCYMDFFARYKRMKGFEVIFPLGLDRNGLPIEMAAEKKFKVSPFQVGREKFIEMCEQILKETSLESTDSFARLGISFTSYKQGNHIGAVYLTDSQEYRTLTQSTFIELLKKGLIYEDLRINNWDPKLQTTIADSEIEYKDIPSKFNYIKWKVKETGEEIIIGTTRPELICTCGMVIFNQIDKRYKHLNGKTAISPIFNKEIPIKTHPLADPEKGTGIVMMCSAGDLFDIAFFREQNLKPVIAINKDGKMNENAGVLNGLKVREAREKILELLNEKNLVDKQENITHRTPISERSGAEIEFIEMPEFYLKQLEFKNEIKKLADKINFYPPESKKILDNWIDSISIDWPISRRRFYATPIPLWKSGNLIAVPKPGKYYVPWKQEAPSDAEVFENNKKIGLAKDFKNKKWIGEERVFDTWMDSSISELYILKYKSDNEFFKKAYPATLRPQGKEIVRTWFYYTLLRGYLETKKPSFEDAWIHQHILDGSGKKMSKSLGNVINPQDLLNEYGAEPIRLWASLEGDLAKQDLKCSRERIGSETKTLTKLWNIGKFVLQFPEAKKPAKLQELDKLFIDYIDYLEDYCDKYYSEYDFHNPALKLRDFLWEIFASHYLEIIKSRAYNKDNKFSKQEQDSALYSLKYLFEKMLVLFYPIIPAITSVLYASCGKNIFKEKLKDSKNKKFDFKTIQEFMDFNSNIWKAKKEKGLSLNAEIKSISIPDDFKKFEKDLMIAHNSKEIKKGKFNVEFK